MSKILFNNFNVTHTVKKSLKNSYISVKPSLDGFEVLLKTPNVSQSFIYELLQEKEAWITKQIDKIKSSPKTIMKLEDELLLFGEIHSVDAEIATFLRDKLAKIRVDNQPRVQACYDKFYKQRAQEYLPTRVEHFSKLMNLDYSELKYRKMRSRWGSCSSKRVITLNTELMKIDKDLIDYVVVHELSHLVHMNHSKEFHSLVDLYICDSQKRRKELKSIYLTLDLK